MACTFRQDTSTQPDMIRSVTSFIDTAAAISNEALFLRGFDLEPTDATQQTNEAAQHTANHCSSMSNRKGTPKTKKKKKMHIAHKSPAIHANSNSFVALTNVNNEDGILTGENLQMANDHISPTIPSSSSHMETNTKDYGEPSTSTGNNKQVIQAKMRDMVIKSKLWKDQRDFDDEEGWGEGLAGYSSSKDDQEFGDDSEGEDIDA